MKYVIIFLAALFIVISLVMFFAYRRVPHYGLFVMALTYGTSGGIALAVMHWWPLVAGFALVWILKLAGMNPDGDLLGERKAEKREGGE